MLDHQVDRLEPKPENWSGCGTACLSSQLFDWHTKTPNPDSARLGGKP